MASGIWSQLVLTSTPKHLCVRKLFIEKIYYTLDIQGTVYPRLSEPRLFESSHIRTAKSRIITLFINILMIFICNRTLCNIFFYVFHISECFSYPNKIIFCLHKGVRISEDALYISLQGNNQQ